MDADELYGLPLERFVPERGALAKWLRTQGRRADAADVAKLRKPSVAGWAVNQLVRTQGRAVRELFQAGDSLRAAQEKVLAGHSDGRALRAANEHERSAVEGLVQTARGLLSSDGHGLSPSIIERVSDTLHAAALDEHARAQVRAGRLERELRHVGMGLGEAATTAAPAPARTSKTKPPSKRAPREKPRKPARADAKRVEAERAAARKAARVAEAQARRRAERAASALRAAAERHERAVTALDEADAALAAARDEVQQAAEAHERAQADLESD